MHRVSEKIDGGGRLEVFEDMDKHLFLARPQGVINPTLLEEDLKQATTFSIRCPDHWTYVTNTEEVKFVNPFNMLFLKEVKKLQKLKEIVVYVPGFFNRMLMYLAVPIFQPDRIIKDRDTFNKFLAEVS